jgi:hypothetical protein
MLLAGLPDHERSVWLLRAVVVDFSGGDDADQGHPGCIGRARRAEEGTVNLVVCLVAGRIARLLAVR